KFSRGPVDNLVYLWTPGRGLTQPVQPQGSVGPGQARPTHHRAVKKLANMKAGHQSDRAGWSQHVRPRHETLDQRILRFSAEVLPRLVISSYSTCWPSLRLLSPARSTAEMWTNTSPPPPWGWMKP